MAEPPAHTPRVELLRQKSMIIEVGDTVLTNYGTCKVKAIREVDGFHCLEPIRWVLANKKPPCYYMLKNHLTLYQKKEDSPDFRFKKYVKMCYECKNEGSSLFKVGDFNGAKVKYWEAIRNMESMGQGLSNSQKAEVFELTVSIHNNLSICFMKLKEYSDSSAYALNSVRLIEALEARAGESSLVFEALVKKGVVKSVSDMNKLWKRKALFCAGKAEMFRKNYDEAIQFLEGAIQIICGDPLFAKDEEEIRSLLNQGKALKKQVLRKEKNMYAKAMKSVSKDKTGTEKVVQWQDEGEQQCTSSHHHHHY